MTISVSCDTCGRRYRLKDAAAGTTVRCKDCESPIKVPSADAEEIEAFGDDEWGDAADTPDDFGGLPPATGRRSESVLPPSPRNEKKQSSSSGSSSNAGPLAKKIGGGLLVLLFALGIAARVMQVVNRGGGHYSWQEYSPPGQPFTMLMPGNPVESTRVEGGITLKTALVTIRNPESTFGFICGDLPIPAGAELDVEAVLAGAKQGILDRLPPGTEITNETIELLRDAEGNLHPGNELAVHTQIEGDRIEFIYHIYLVGPKLVMAHVGVPVEDADELRGDMTKFLRSLKVNGSVPVIGWPDSWGKIQ